MHELKQEFEVLLARLDCMLTLIEKGSPASAEHLVNGVQQQVEKTKHILDKTIEDFRVFDAVGDPEEGAENEVDPEAVRMLVAGDEAEEEDDDEEDDDEEDEEEEEEPTKEE